MTADDVRKLAEQMDVLRDVDRIKPHATKVLRALADVVEAATGLLERVDRNGGIGEYTGGPAFVVKRTREALARVEALKP